MAFSEQSLADARQQGYSDDEIFDHIAKSDERFSVAKQQGYSLDDIASHLKQKEGGVNYEDATSQSGQGPRDNRNEQAVSGEVQATNQVGVQADSMLPAEDQSQLRSDDQASVTTGIAQGGELIEGQTKDAQGGIQGEEDGQGIPSQVTTGDEAQVIAPQQAAMQAAPFGAEGVQSVPAKSFAQGAFESIRDFGAETLSNIGQSIYGSMAGIVRTEPEYIDLPSLGAKVKNPRFEEQQKLVNYFEGLKKESAEAPEIMGAKPLEGIPKVAAEVTGGLLKLPAQVGTGLIGFTSLIGEAYGSAKEGFYQKAKEQGMSDDEAVKASESKAIATTAAALPIYYIAGKGAGAILDKVVSEATPKIVDAALRVGLNTVANAIGSATIRGVTAALDGEDVEKAVKDVTVPGLIQDFAFASHAAVTYFKEQAAKGNGKEAARDLPDPVLDKVAQDPRYAGIVAPEVAARAETRVAQQAKTENLPETAAALEATAKGEIEAAPTELPKEPVVAEKAPTAPEQAPVVEPTAEAPAEAQPTKPSESQAPAAEAAKPTAVKAEEGVAPREGEGEAGQVAVEIKRPKTYQEAQDLIDSIENDLEGRGIDVFKLYDEGSESLEKIGYTKMPPELSEAYKIRDEIGKQELQTNVDDVKSILKNKTSDNEAKRVLKVYAIDETDAAGQYMASEYFVSTVKSDPLKQAEKISIILAGERGEFFDEVKDISEKTKQDAVDIVVGLGNYLGVDHAQSFKKQIAPQEVERLAIEKPVEAPAAPQAEPTFLQKAESWADSVIKESSKRVSTGLDPEVLVAYAFKGSVIIARGVRNFGVWSGEMVKQFGEEIRPHLKDIWSRAKSYAEDEAKIQMETQEYIQRREEAVAGGGPTVMRGVSERLAKQANKELKQSDEFKSWEAEKERLAKEWKDTPPKSEERKQAREKYREHIKNKPESPKKYYIQADELVRRRSLSDAVVMEWVNSLTPEQAKIEYERAIFAPASDEIAAIKGKLAARRAADLNAAGDAEGYARVVNEIGREATLGSYVLRDLQFLYKATPKGYTMLLEKVAEGKNIKIKPEKIAEIEGQFKDFTEAGKLSEAKELEVINAQSEAEFNAALKDLEKLRKEGFKKQNAFDKSVGGIWPKSGREELIPTLLKGNLLTTMSVATNLAQNVLKGTFLDVPQKLIQSKYSKVESLLTGKEPKYTFGLEQAVMYYATLAKESPELVRNLFRTALRQPLPADKPVNIMEIRSSLNPMAALRRLKGLYNKEDLQYEGDYRFKEAIKDSLEATTGVWADVMFDLLTATDRPFRQAVMISESSGMARRLGIKGLDYEKFVKLPQRGIEKWARENIKDPAKRAEEIKSLKQELDDAVSAGLGESEVKIAGKNVTRGVSNFLNNIAKSNPVSSLLVYANAPYVRFPLNFAVTSFKLANPEVAMVSFAINAARGNSKKAAIDFSVMATGVAIAYAGKYLYDQGVIQTTDSPQTKAQKLSGEIGRAGSINLSKLKRIANGESSDTMPGDKIQRLDRLGVIGVALLNEADKQEALKKKKLLTGEVSFADALITRMAQLPVSLSYSLNQTFTKGVAGVVDALTQGERKWEKLFQNTFSASLSLVAPNELSAISRYISEYTPNLDDPKFMKTMENAVRQRFGMSGDLPVKRGFWGEKITSTPEGANPIAYHFFDFTKQRKLPSVPATMEIIRLFEKTRDNRIIPAEVEDKITVKGTSYRLSAKDHERYQEIVGGERLNRVNKLIDTPSYQSASVDRKADRYTKAIDRGARMGERKFLQELQKSGREAGEVLKIPRKELIRRISELENED
jgi:FtsZ-interacting cell division protein YlmF